MRLGDLLLRAGLINQEQLKEVLNRQASHGGRLGENLIAAGFIESGVLENFIHRVPREPNDLAATGIDPVSLLRLALKLIYTGRLETLDQVCDAIKLPQHIVRELIQMASGRQLIRALGERDGTPLYALSDEGRAWAQEALEQSQYAGPAPVPLADFNALVELQKVNNLIISIDKIRSALQGLVVEDRFIEQLGPALNSDRTILMYGPPGNGKTSVALRIAALFEDLIYLPYAVEIGGQIMRVFDPSVHQPLSTPEVEMETRPSLIRPEECDTRWVPCQRPFIITGGELTLEMLDLKYNTTANFYEAPLHVKALGGCFVIDDFGRQLVSPRSLLNRWIVPMESRRDYLKLHTGKSFSIPFEELLIFSTNLDPEELMDPAFLRRLPYKLEVGAPSVDQFRRIFEGLCEPLHLELSEQDLDGIVQRITEDKGLELAGYQPKFILDQVVAACRFFDQPLRLESRFIDYAVDNLRVHRPAPAG